ncbi:MAG: DUF975 family protein [Firmicutes bacterium]|nr:DUF975 family protein [Bacillota bacterium]
MNYGQYNIVQERPRTIRALARQALQGRWLEAFILLIVAAAIEQVPVMILNRLPGNFFGFLASLYSILVSGIITVGVCWYFIKLFRQRQGGLDDLKYGLGFAQRAIVLHILIVIKIFLWTLLFIIPGIIAAFRYSMAPYILADDPNKDPGQCIAESCEMMKGNKMAYFILMLSFIGWFILASIPSGLMESTMTSSARAALSAGGDLSVYWEAVSKVASNPLLFLAGIPTYLVNAYMNTSTACFYDLANGNLSVGGYDYAAAQGHVEDPFTGEDVKFTDVPAEVVPEDLPEKFDDPELKSAEEKYTGDDNIYGE